MRTRLRAWKLHLLKRGSVVSRCLSMLFLWLRGWTAQFTQRLLLFELLYVNFIGAMSTASLRSRWFTLSEGSSSILSAQWSVIGSSSLSLNWIFRSCSSSLIHPWILSSRISAWGISRIGIIVSWRHSSSISFLSFSTWSMWCPLSSLLTVSS